MQQAIISHLDKDKIIAKDGNNVYHVKDNIYVYPTEIGKYDGFIFYESINDDGFITCVPKTKGKRYIITDYYAHKEDIDDFHAIVAEDEFDFFNSVNIITIFKL